MRFAPKYLILIGLLLAGLTACGGDDDDGDALAAAIGDQLAEDASGDGFDLTSDESGCVGEAFVDTVGADKLDELGVTADDVSTLDDIDETELGIDDAQSAALIFDCLSFDTMVGVLAEGAGDDAVDCLKDVGEDNIRSMMQAGIDQDEGSLDTEVLAEITACLA